MQEVGRFCNDNRKEEQERLNEILRKINSILNHIEFIRDNHSALSVLVKMILRYGNRPEHYTSARIRTAIRWIDADVVTQLEGKAAP